jgi:hypothetical protein
MNRLLVALAAGCVLLCTTSIVFTQGRTMKVTYSRPLSSPPKDFRGDAGYESYPRFLADVDGDGVRDFCRGVGGNPPYMACILGQSGGRWSERVYRSADKLDWGYPQVKDVAEPRWMEDVNEDGRADFCRYVGGNPPYPAALLAGEHEFSEESVRIVKTREGWRVAD